MRDDFAIFIISHGRADITTTSNVLVKHGYTGKWYIVLDDLDNQIDKYIDRFGKEHIIVFDKMAFVIRTDTGMHKPLIKFAVFARNAVEHIAKEMGLKYFGIFDDDILKFRFRFNKDNHLLSKDLFCLDYVLDEYLKMLEPDNVQCVAFGTPSSYAGGISGYDNWYRVSRRVCFQTMLRKVSSPVDWRLNMLEDVITALHYGKLGNVWMQFLDVEFDIMPVGQAKIPGGNSDTYKIFSEFNQSCFPLIYAPNCHYITVVKSRYRYKFVQADFVLPKIISGRYKK